MSTYQLFDMPVFKNRHLRRPHQIYFHPSGSVTSIPAVWIVVLMMKDSTASLYSH